MRNAFVDSLCEYVSKGNEAWLLTGDLGYGVVEPFSRRYPQYFLNCGVNEQHMMSMAAGIASTGCPVFVYSIANFPTFRCAEQIRNDVDYHCLPVCIVSVGAGLSYGALGYSHHAIQDVGLMRLMPNMNILAPVDPIQTSKSVNFFLDEKRPCYLRMGKAGEPNISNPDNQLQLNRLNYLGDSQNDGSRTVAILGIGPILGRLKVQTEPYVADSLDFFSVPVWSTAGKLPVEDIKKLDRYNKILIIEDHIEAGGFGSWVVETLLSAGKFDLGKIKRFSLNRSVINDVGDQRFLEEKYGLDFNMIIKEINFF